MDGKDLARLVRLSEAGRDRFLKKLSKQERARFERQAEIDVPRFLRYRKHKKSVDKPLLPAI